MVRPSWKSILLGAMVALAMIGIVSNAEAGCWRSACCSVPCYYPCHTSCYTPCCYTSCCYTPCCSPCWHHGCWHHRPWLRPWLWGHHCGYHHGCGYGGYYGGYAGYEVGYGGGISIGSGGEITIPGGLGNLQGLLGNGVILPGSTVIDGQTTVQTPAQAAQPATKVEQAPVAPPTPSDKPLTPSTPAPPAAKPTAQPAPVLPGELPALPGTTYITPTKDDSATLTIYVPVDAKVTINGMATKSNGSKRQYVSFGLKAGYTYKYEVRAEIVREGQAIEESRTVTLTAGQRGAVAFGFNSRNGEGLAANSL